jgi:DNA-directed RNA polymerase II subunit RPB1
MTLNTFHMAGVASKSQVTRGVPRFKELLSVSPSIKGPQATIVLKPAYSSDQDKAQMVMNKITITTIRQLVQSSEVYYKSGGLEREFQVAEGFCEPLAGEKTLSPWVLKISFDKRKMLDKGIEMTDIYFAVISQFNIEQEDVRCLFTDDNSQSLVLCIQCILDKTEDADGEDDDMINILKTMEKTILNDISLTGIRNIKSAFLDKDKTNMVYDAATGNYKTQERWVIKTIGTNLADILADPRVDAYCTFSNDVVEIYQTLGIEAARQALMKEIKEVFEDAGSYINLRHIMLLADVMTNRGYLMPMDRHGINKSDRGPLAKCSFEETADVIARAAIFGELDRLNGVSANIMLGQEVPIGTGSVDIVFDEEMYEKWSLAMETDETGETPALEVKTIDPVRQVFMNQYCTLENLDMGI